MVRLHDIYSNAIVCVAVTNFVIPCACGTSYIRETGHTLLLRVQEHRWVVRNWDMNNGIAVHVMKTHHNIQWEEARVILTKPQLTRRKVKKALGLIIRRTQNSMNLDKGVQLDKIIQSHMVSSTTLMSLLVVLYYS